MGDFAETHGTDASSFAFPEYITLPATGSEMNSGGVITKIDPSQIVIWRIPMFFRNFRSGIRIKPLACRRASWLMAWWMRLFMSLNST